MSIEKSTIPERTKVGIDLYISNHTKPGGFLQAVLQNHLVDAYARADAENKKAIEGILHYLYWSELGEWYK